MPVDALLAATRALVEATDRDLAMKDGGYATH
ncbi:uncharacterized protein METZ01_LOCUS218493 [marine metagenome]|uniref:Uncharacterized protein n=1 Tax=marine metagenome TaxID=408172 RepID=A0A382FSJ4_9ZZZZ